MLKRNTGFLLAAAGVGFGVFSFSGSASAQIAVEKPADILSSFKADAEAAMLELSALLKIVFIGAISGATGVMAIALYKRVTGI